MSLDPERQAAWKLLFEKVGDKAKARAKARVLSKSQPPPGVSAAEWKEGILAAIKSLEMFGDATLGDDETETPEPGGEPR